MTRKFGRLTAQHIELDLLVRCLRTAKFAAPTQTFVLTTLIPGFALRLTAPTSDLLQDFSSAMLPTLSERWGANLQVLIPTTSDPESASARRNALHELKKVDSIRVYGSGRGSKACYAVEASVGSQTATSCLGLSTAATGATVRVERELSEFKDFANEIHEIVDTAHPGQRCKFCSEVLNWYVFGENPDGLLLIFASSERIARTLTKFLEELLALTIKYAATDIHGSCSGHVLVPQVVHNFLFNSPAPCDAA